MLHDFSALEHSLKKHIRLNPEDEKSIKKYLEEPLNALINDYELIIKNILDKVEENILAKKIELKDKKKEKTLQILNKINKAQLASFLTEYNKLMVELREASERIGAHTIIDEIEDIKIKLKDKKEDIEKIKEKLNILTEDISKIDLHKLKSRLKEKINNLLDIDIDID